MQMQVFLNDLHSFAQQFWNYVQSAKVFAWHGEMGAGKTTLITALGRQKGVKNSMSSPTFSIINQYEFEHNGKEKIIYHIDLYRLENVEEAKQAGVEDAIYSGEICMLEWPQKASQLFDDNTVHVFIDIVEDNIRLLRIELPNNRNLET